MNSIRILLVDDHALVRSGIRNALLELEGAQIVGEAADGSELLPAVEALRPDCLLVDVTMPNFDPIVDISRMRAQYPAMKILVVSAYDDDVYVQGLLQAGVNGYHLKDQPLSDLRLAVERVMAGERWVTGRLLDKLINPVRQDADLPSLTSRQREILQLLHAGLDNQAIAQKIGISVKTVENHLTRLYRQLGVQSRLEAASFAQRDPRLLLDRPAGPPRGAARPRSADIELKADVHTVLLVDDNRRFRQQLQRMIRKLDDRVVVEEAADIAAALRQTQRLQPRLVFVDVVLGSEDGISCTRQIKRISAASRVILISAYPDREFHRLGIRAGAAAFLDKKNLDSGALHHILQDVFA